ncbi:MAG TPA: hypothetical protein VFD36_25100 [Kofleriaceae bacterium]|nr:hypothetical protein [Kofleriaceae bacterium]
MKTRRPASHARAGNTIARERAALTLLAELGANVGPRVLAHGEDFLVLEDLGRGPAVEDLLIGDDRAAATDALVALARAVGAMQAASHGHEAMFRDRLEAAGIDTRADRVTIARSSVADRWVTLRELAATGAVLPGTSVADADIDEVSAQLADPGSWLALSSGDVAPQNCRLGDRSVRLLDFEDASYRHALLDVASLRLPFCGAPCWSRLPVDVTDAMEDAARAELGRSCPEVLDPRTYATGMAVATAAWAVTRLVRLPKLLARDEPHPMGFSRRGQLLDTIQLAIDAAAAAGTLDDLRSWFEQAAAALRRVWPGLPPRQPLYPAFRSDGTSH